MIAPSRFLSRAAMATLASASFAHCTLLVSDLPDPIEATSSDGGGAGADDSDTGGRAGSNAARGGNGSAGEDGAGGTTSGGSSAGGNAGRTTGGASSGGASSGGATTGGNSTGGNSTGGNSTGGNSTGGNSTGGNSTGGNSTGGDATGGRASGGTTGGGASGVGGGGAPVDCDRDDDGVAAPGATGCAGPDCDDTDSDAHPGQQSFFEDARASGGFDYDCSGRSEKQFETALDCALLSVGNCSGEGFSGSPPACGASGNWIRCVTTVSPLPLLCTAENVEMRRMPCH
jgi:hypothetical protein